MIDCPRFQTERGDDPVVPFSFVSPPIVREQIDCHLIHTTPALHELVRASISRSPLYNGQISGIGPRYCPSLEDKVMRFPDKARHQIFLEPEGLDVDEIYVNGLSMSLPRDVQGQSCTRCRVSRAPECCGTRMPSSTTSSIRPSSIGRWRPSVCPDSSWPVKSTARPGYEEAAAQGVVAGLNAARGPATARRSS